MHRLRIAPPRTDFLFLFEHTGFASEPFTRRGFHTTIVDLLNHRPNPRASCSLNWDILKQEDELVALAKTARFVFGMPTCSDLSISGNGPAKRKLKENPNYLAEALHLFLSVRRIGKRAGTPYCIENPVGRVSTLWRKPNYVFNPYDYGGYLPEDDVNPRFDIIEPRDAYPKKTCYWTGNGFRIPERRPVPVKPGYAAHFNRLGGKSANTKLIRAASPRGFFEALAQLYCDNESETARGRMLYNRRFVSALSGID